MKKAKLSVPVFDCFNTIQIGGLKVNNKLSKNKSLDIIDLRLSELSEEEILKLIEKELSKENAQVDMDYIDVCYDLLEINRSNENRRREIVEKSKIKKPMKVLFIAAVFVFVSVSTIVVSAQIFNFNIPQKIAEFINGNAEIDYNMENADTIADGYVLLDTDLATVLAESGVTPVTFPEEMVKENCKIIQIESRTNDETVSKNAYVRFSYNGCYGNLTISQFSEKLDWVGTQSVMDVETGEMIKVNGMDVLVFEQKGGCTIKYKDNLTEYRIYIESNLDIALNLAKSIK